MDAGTVTPLQAVVASTLLPSTRAILRPRRNLRYSPSMMRSLTAASNGDDE